MTTTLMVLPKVKVAMTDNSESLVRVIYPDAMGDDNSTEFEAIDEWGRFALVYGPVPMPPAERPTTAFMVVNRVFDTVEYYSHSYVQARATMHQLEGLWDNLDDVQAAEDRRVFEEEDREMEAEEAAVNALVPPFGSIN